MMTLVEVRDRSFAIAFRIKVVLPELREPKTSRFIDELDSDSLAYSNTELIQTQLSED